MNIERRQHVRVKPNKNITFSVNLQEENRTMAFRNTPNMTNENNEGKVKRYVHQPLVVEHYGIHAKIQENGRVLISGQGTLVPGSKDEYEYDEVEIPASLVFKLAMMLKATRTIKYVSVAEAATLPEVGKDND